MTEPAPVRAWLHEPVSSEVDAALARLACIDDVAVIAAMPDVHLARAVCVGAVVATRTALFPDAVGGDIGCGMAALRFDCGAEVLSDRSAAARVLAMLGRRIPTSSHRSASARLPDLLDERPLSAAGLERKKASVGRVQFATLGKGNHFVELQRDADGALWLMLHSGSRGMGQAIRQHHGGADGELGSIAAESGDGHAYLGDLQWALDYAQLSRRRMVEEVCDGLAELLGVTGLRDTYLDCHHNFVRLEKHDPGWLWVHRKGAISAREGEPGIIPGSMGSTSFHVTGRGNRDALCSSSHGAGRVMSRSEARRRISVRRLGEQMSGVWFDHRIANRLRDEAPGAYKDIGAVMRAQRTLTRIERRLEPVLVYKGT
jgi:tRNA-splicing ligase RtcB